MYDDVAGNESAAFVRMDMSRWNRRGLDCAGQTYEAFRRNQFLIHLPIYDLLAGGRSVQPELADLRQLGNQPS